jgi:macrodomain Ter protein organizer (MatP/YcbG family)
MTNQEELAVIQRTRLEDASQTVLNLANDADTPEKYEPELRTMARRLKDISREIGAGVSVRKARTLHNHE